MMTLSMEVEETSASLGLVYRNVNEICIFTLCKVYSCVIQMLISLTSYPVSKWHCNDYLRIFCAKFV